MSRRRRASRLEGHGPNMTPMVDVVMVILIFFMAAMGLSVAEQYLRTGLPVTGSERSDSPEKSGLDSSHELPASRALLSLRRAGGQTLVTGLGMSDVPLSRVDERLKRFADAGAADTLIVIVSPQPDVPYQDVVIVHDSCARAGVVNVRLAIVESGG